MNNQDVIQEAEELTADELIIEEADLSFKRLDLLLVHKFPELSRTLIKKLFEDEHIYCLEGKVELKRVPPVGTKIFIEKPLIEDYSIEPQNIPLNILYEDKYLVIVDKQPGMVVHPAAGNWQGTLVHAILWHCKDISGVGNVKRPGIVHRLDKGTSGVMVVAKEQKTHEKLSEMFKAHNLERNYEALVIEKSIPNNGKIVSLINRDPHHRLKMSCLTKTGKTAITHYRVLEKFQHCMHMELTLETGRTHQIRVHLSQKLQCAIINDHLYGNPKQQMHKLPSEVKSLLQDFPYPLLHAKRLAFNHPITNEYMDFKSEVHDPFKACLGELRKNDLK